MMSYSVLCVDLTIYALLAFYYNIYTILCRVVFALAFGIKNNEQWNAIATSYGRN